MHTEKHVRSVAGVRKRESKNEMEEEERGREKK
jgi:hypothetical protein